MVKIDSDRRPVLVTGGNGQLATSLSNLGGERVCRVGRPEFDFDRPETVSYTHLTLPTILLV